MNEGIISPSWSRWPSSPARFERYLQSGLRSVAGAISKNLLATALGLALGAVGTVRAGAPVETTAPVTVTFDTVTYGNSTIELPAWKEPDGMEAVGVLGSSRSGRLFMDETLPALFTRTLVLEEPIAKGRELKWVFTGPRAGLTVILQPGRVRFVARYYDSHALHPEPVLAGNGQAGWFPEKEMTLLDASHKGAIRAVTLVMHHNMEVELRLDGASVVRSRYLEDVLRHQLQVGENQKPPSWRMLRPAAINVTVRIDPSQRHQQMLGWGGITSMPAYQMLGENAKERWWDFLREFGFNIQREYPAGRSLEKGMKNLGSPDAAVHHTYADNFANGETTDFDYLRKHRELPGSSIWYEYWWHLPSWTYDDAEAYAESIVHYCKRVEQATGRAPEVVGVQNEHRAANWREQVPALRRHLDAAGYGNIKIHMNDDSKITDIGLEWLKDYRAEPKLWEILDYTACHQYDFRDSRSDPDGFDAVLWEWRELSVDKPYLSTELCVNGRNWQVRSYRLALMMAQQYHKTLTIADAVAVCYCWLLLDVEQPSYNWTRSLMGVDKENGLVAAPTSHQLRTYGAYSRRVPRGMTRIEAESGHPDLLVSAFRNDEGGATVILLNRSTEPLMAEIGGLEETLETAERTSATMPNRIDDAFDPSTPVRIDPGEIVTLTNVGLGLGGARGAPLDSIHPPAIRGAGPPASIRRTTDRRPWFR